MIPRRPLARGAYRVQWRTVGTRDGHLLEGSFSFGVRASAAAAQAAGDRPAGARRLGARAGARRAVRRRAAAGRRAAAAAARARPARLAGAGAARQRARHRAPARARAAHDRRPGVADRGGRGGGGGGRGGGRGGRAVRRRAVGLPARQRRRASARVLDGRAARGLRAGARAQRRARRRALAVLALGALAASGHAGSADPRVPSILNDWLHLVAGAAWLGGIALLGAAVVAPAARRRARRRGWRWRARCWRRSGASRPARSPSPSRPGWSAWSPSSGAWPRCGTRATGGCWRSRSPSSALIAAISAAHALRLRPRLLAANPHPPERARAPPLAAVARRAVARRSPWSASWPRWSVFPLPPRQLAEAGGAPVVGLRPLPAAAPRRGRARRRRRGGLAARGRLDPPHAAGGHRDGARAGHARAPVRRAGRAAGREHGRLRPRLPALPPAAGRRRGRGRGARARHALRDAACPRAGRPAGAPARAGCSTAPRRRCAGCGASASWSG